MAEAARARPGRRGRGAARGAGRPGRHDRGRGRGGAAGRGARRGRAAGDRDHAPDAGRARGAPRGRGRRARRARRRGHGARRPRRPTPRSTPGRGSSSRRGWSMPSSRPAGGAASSSCRESRRRRSSCARSTLGCSTVKLFPAAVLGGPALIRALTALGTGATFVPTGGITLDTRPVLPGPARGRRGRRQLDGPRRPDRGGDWDAVRALADACSVLRSPAALSAVAGSARSR